KNSSQSPPQINHHCFYGCGDPLEVPIIPNPEPFNNQIIKELPPTVQSFDPKSDLVHDSPNDFDPPPQLTFYSCEFCGNDARYGQYCTPQVPFVYPEPCYNQDFNSSQEFQDFHVFQQQDICYENCGVTHEAYQFPLGIDETDCYPEEETHFIKRLLYDNSSPRPPKEFISKNYDAEIESLSPFPIPVEDSDSLTEEIDLSFTPDYPMPPSIEDDDYDSERDVLILDELLSNNSLSLLENESFHFDIPSFSRSPAKPPDSNTRILNVKMIGDISEQK
nr:hypothetical protein [Tanacetum cinerariifolium]